MKKFTAIAAMLAMVLVAAAPATAQTVEGDVTEGDRQYVGEDATFQSAENVQYSVNVLAGDNTTDTNNFIGGDTGDENAIGGGNIDQSLSNESSQDVQNAFADDGSIAFNGFDDEDDNENRFFYYEDADFDGIADVFDYFVLFGDFDDNDVNGDVNATASAFAYSE